MHGESPTQTTASPGEAVTCVGFLRRRQRKDSLQADHEVPEDNVCPFEITDDYHAMKQKLLNQPAHLPRHHLTERDVQTSFLCENDSKTRGFSGRLQRGCKKIATQYCHPGGGWMHLLRRTFPILDFLRTYKRSYFGGDLAAGLSVGVAAIPMGMSYALLARLPPAHGLYNNIFYPLFYMFFATGRQVCLGTSAIEAMMSAEAVAKIVGWDAPADVWLNASIGLSFFVGCIFFLLRLLQFGVVARFLADPVLSGFSTGSAITIASSQLKYVFGLTMPRLGTIQTWWYVLTHLNETKWACVLISFLGITMLSISKLVNRRWFKRFPLPGALIMLATFVLLSYLMGLHNPPYNVPIVGVIPAGLPAPIAFNFDSSLILPMFQQALWYSLIYFVIHISIAKTIAQQRGYVLDANQEFFACGLGGILGSFFQCYPIATSVSRSSIANTTGANTPLWNIPNVLVVGLTVTVITPLLYLLPMPALASVVMFGVYGMMYFREAYKLLKLWSPDFLLWMTCCCVTVIWGAMEGVIAGVALSILWLLKKNTFPNIAILGRLPETTIYRNIKRFPVAKEIDGCKIIRFDASLNFSNADQFEEKIVEAAGLNAKLDNHLASNSDESACSSVKVVIIDTSSINDMDVSAIRMLKSLARRMHEENRVLLFANWKAPMRDFLERTRFYEVVPPEHCFLSLHDAALWSETFYLPRTTYQGVTDIAPTENLTDEAKPRRPREGSQHQMRFVTESTDTVQREWPVMTSTPTPLYREP